MNRPIAAVLAFTNRKPHIRGDEPLPFGYIGIVWFVSPTYVGMNRSIQASR